MGDVLQFAESSTRHLAACERPDDGLMDVERLLLRNLIWRLVDAKYVTLAQDIDRLIAANSATDVERDELDALVDLGLTITGPLAL